MEVGRIDVDGQSFRLDKVVGVYQLWTMGLLPFPTVTIQVTLRGVQDYLAIPEVVIRNPDSGELEHTCGLGTTEEGALTDCIDSFFSEVKKYSAVRELAEQDFAWRVGNKWLS
jgi:hypothetical protein